MAVKMHGRLGGAVLALMAAASLSGCGTPLGGMPPLENQQAAIYRADTGDMLQVTVQNLDTANGKYAVDDDGQISLPMLDPLPVRGLSLRELEDRLEQALLEAGILTEPSANVEPANLRPFYVLGEVNSPGEFAYRQGQTVLAALAAAGGYTYRAKSGAVAITRTVSGEEMTFRADENTIILPGDRIRVYERWF